MCLKKCNNSTTDYLSSIIDSHNELKSLVKEIEEIAEQRSSLIWEEIAGEVNEQTSLVYLIDREKQCQSRIFEIIKSL